jgi:O-antigen biosynthesis protein
MAIAESTSEPVQWDWRSDAPQGVAEPISALDKTRATTIAFARQRIAERVSELEEALRERDETIRVLNDRLASIHASRSWRLAAACARFSGRLLPLGSYRRKVVRFLARNALGCWRRVVGADMTDIFPASQDAYPRWIAKNEPSAKDLRRQRKTRFAFSPRISMVVPVYNTPPGFLRAMLDSVRAQTYGNWELCLADGASPGPETARILKEYARRDPRIRLALLPENRGIAGNTRAALELARGEYVAFVDHDDTLAPFALYEIVRALNQDRELDFLYSDEDLLDEEGRRHHPHFKPDWSPDTLRSHNYICHLVAIRRELLERVGGLREGFDGSQDYDVVLRATERASRVHHIPKVLYHWRRHSAAMSCGDGKHQAYQAAKKALGEHLARQAVEGTVNDGLLASTYEVRRALPNQPLISIIIPTQDQVDVLARCLDSIMRSTYARYEILLVENNSRNPETFDFYRTLREWPKIRVIPWNQTFNFSKLNNFAATHARGDVLLFLNNDVEAQSADWLERMLEHALRPEVGAVGAKLFYPDGNVQHAGIIVGINGVAGHAHKHFSASSPGYFHRLMVTQNMSAITGACIMMRKDVFREIEGFDERLVIAFNDVDLCMRVRRSGYWIVWTPFAALTHYESKTRGPEDNPEKRRRLAKEAHIFIANWREELRRGDPFYSPNLSLSSEDFALRL